MPQKSAHDSNQSPQVKYVYNPVPPSSRLAYWGTARATTLPPHPDTSSNCQASPSRYRPHCCGAEGYLNVVNVGTERIAWQRGDVLARSCSSESSTQSDIQVSQSATPTLPLPLARNILSKHFVLARQCDIYLVFILFIDQ